MELPPPVDDTGRPLTKPNGGAAPGRMTALLPPAVEEEEDEMPSLPAVGISRATNKRLAAPSQKDDQCGLPLPKDAQDCCSFLVRIWDLLTSRFFDIQPRPSSRYAFMDVKKEDEDE
eukprot:s12687_g1.t1